MASISRFRPAFGATSFPGYSSAPLPEQVIPFVFKSSNALVPALSASLRLTWCYQFLSSFAIFGRILARWRNAFSLLHSISVFAWSK